MCVGVFMFVCVCVCACSVCVYECILLATIKIFSPPSPPWREGWLGDRGDKNLGGKCEIPHLVVLAPTVNLRKVKQIEENYFPLELNFMKCYEGVGKKHVSKDNVLMWRTGGERPASPGGPEETSLRIAADYTTGPQTSPQPHPLQGETGFFFLFFVTHPHCAR